MTLTSSWSIASDDENSRQSFLSDWDSEFDLTPSSRYSTEKCSMSALKTSSINRNEPPLTRSRAKDTGHTVPIPQLIAKEQRQSTMRRSMDSFTGMATTLTSSILFPKQQSSDNRTPVSPTDGVNSLTDWLESCSLDENKLNKSCLWPSHETNSHYLRPLNASLPHVTLSSNPFNMSQTSPLFVQSSSTTTVFDQQQTQLWSRFRYAASTIRDNLWIEQLNSTPSNTFTSLNNNNNSNHHFSNQSPMLSSQKVPYLLSNFTSSSNPLLSQSQDPKLLTEKEDRTVRHSHWKIFFTIMIFVVGLVLGYLLTNTYPPDLIRQWVFIIWKICTRISIEYLQLLYAYLQTVMKQYFSSFL